MLLWANRLIRKMRRGGAAVSPPGTTGAGLARCHSCGRPNHHGGGCLCEVVSVCTARP
jgi:hypothetical protein